MPAEPIPRCAECGEALPPRAKRGPARRYCSSRCRVAAHRARGVPEDLEAWVDPEADESVPVDRPVTARAISALTGGGEDSGSPETRLAQVLLDAHGVAGRLRRLMPSLPRELRWRAEGTAADLTSSLARHFPTDEGAPL